ncbi:type IV toxin-antitoxin system AbiEi family antitoxin domain-containing protein [Sphingobium sp. RSMS]|uniref:type IV toxin-antitoxin system AbiEi family antitoxin domain-containing protein n=1 Tax=Sphingobium sp. RSMS TaxID=520734 RepID=UPI0014857AE6|nr:type IV toxin-antitoxin system AbiEi family antitoxin domain-containing protein [Sphingobium sp. RSMS]UXC90271.1 type IV toxin-antitoxin system AbiEi family antitoxin domain-containing protein [Sphingobium sp. RSMS]
MSDQLVGTQLSIWRPGSMFLSQDEILLLISLAAMQRRSWRAFRCALDPGLVEVLRKCAVALAEANVCMPIKAFARLDMIAQLGSPSIEVARSNAHPRNSTLDIDDGSIGATVIAMLQERNLVSTREFEAAGISRQYLSLLCKKGYLRRVRHGWYGAC